MENNQENEFEKLLENTFTENKSLEPGVLIEAEIVAIFTGMYPPSHWDGKELKGQAWTPPKYG